MADDELETLEHEFHENYMKKYKVYGYMDYFYRENIDQFTPDDDAVIDKEVYVHEKGPYEEIEPLDPEEIENRTREYKEAEARVDAELAERRAKYEREHPRKDEH